MKCPYRTKTITVTPVDPAILDTVDGRVIITKIKHSEFKECYGEECPFYRGSDQYSEPICARVEEETGDIL